MSVCVCVRERERENVCVCEREDEERRLSAAVDVLELNGEFDTKHHI